MMCYCRQAAAGVTCRCPSKCMHASLIDMYVHVYTCACMYCSVLFFALGFVCACTCVHIYIYMCVCVCVCVYLSVCVCLCLCSFGCLFICLCVYVIIRK